MRRRIRRKRKPPAFILAAFMMLLYGANAALVYARPESGLILRTDAAPQGAPPNDDCSQATVIGDGTVYGETDEATNDGASSCDGLAPAPDVWFQYVASTSGVITANTFGPESLYFDVVLSVHKGCPGTVANEFTCSDGVNDPNSAVRFPVSAGGEYWIRVSSYSGWPASFRLNVGVSGEISGRVTAAATGDPLTGGGVVIWNTQGHYAGYGVTDSLGLYTVPPPAGSYYIATWGFADYVPELWDDIPCPDCMLEDSLPDIGDAVVVTTGTTTENIDFALQVGGRISGVVTAAATGDPIANVRLEIYDSDGSLIHYAYTDSAGNYSVRGLFTGSHYVSAEKSDFLDELYDGIPCPGGTPTGCNPTTGTPIPVTLGATAAGIDFSLHTFGAISGTVTEATTGEPLRDMHVVIWNDDGVQAGSYYYTDDSGRYTVAGLAEGTYYATTSNDYGFNDRLYDDIPCPGGAYNGCDPRTGTPIPVILNATTAGIDFALDGLGVISGTVVEALIGEPVSGIRVDIWNSSGFLVTSDHTDSSGFYTVTWLPEGTYFAATEGYFEDFLGKLYDDIPCSGGPPGGCDPTTGMPIPVTVNTATTGIDFALHKDYGTISGTVIDAATGEPLGGVWVWVWEDPYGSYGIRTNSAGFYEIAFTPGTYYVTTDNWYGYRDELYDDIPCPYAGLPYGCDPTTGTPVVVTAGMATRHIHFALEPYDDDEWISGMVTDESSDLPIMGVYIDAWDADGLFVASTVTDATGRYHLDAPPWAYPHLYVSTDNGQGFTDEVWDDVLCPDGPAVAGLCDPTQGALISYWDMPVTGIDFALGGTEIFSDGFESGDPSRWSSIIGGSP